MSYIGKNIKKIRSVKKLSQSAFADIFGLKRTSIGAYEEGRAEPKIDKVIDDIKRDKLSKATLGGCIIKKINQTVIISKE